MWEGIPNRRLEKKRETPINNDVITYILPPDELEKYRAYTVKPYFEWKKPINVYKGGFRKKKEA